MKRIIISLVLAVLAALQLNAQSFRLQLPESIPQEASALLGQRLTQMLEGGGLSVNPEASAVLEVSAKICDRLETPGSMSQIVLNIELTATAGEVSEVFPLKGVGETESDAWLRAVKQFLPKSKAAQSFVQRLK